MRGMIDTVLLVARVPRSVHRRTVPAGSPATPPLWRRPVVVLLPVESAPDALDLGDLGDLGWTLRVGAVPTVLAVRFVEAPIRSRARWANGQDR
ncbi:hypothetical protein NUM3379_16810 [Kineococcus sp. NUM-3379]